MTPKGLVAVTWEESLVGANPLQCRSARALRTAAHWEIAPPGTIEGGDLIRLDDYTFAVGIGPRTNDAGVDQLQSILGAAVEIHRVPLPPLAIPRMYST